MIRLWICLALLFLIITKIFLDFFFCEPLIEKHCKTFVSHVNIYCMFELNKTGALDVFFDSLNVDFIMDVAIQIKLEYMFRYRCPYPAQLQELFDYR